MSKAFKINLLAIVIGIIYFIGATVKLFTGVAKATKTAAQKQTNEWVEEPMMIEK